MVLFVLFKIYFSFIFFFCNCNNNITYYNQENNKHLNVSNNLKNSYLEKNNTSINKESKRKLQQKNYNQIRIKIDTTCLEKEVPEERIGILNESLYIAKETLETLIKVEKMQSGIIISSYGSHTELDNLRTCSGRNVSNDRFPTFDLVIYVRKYDSLKDNFDIVDESFQSFPCKPKIIIYNSGDERPIVGSLIYHDLPFLTNEVYTKERLKYLFLHEMTHILGFTKEVLTKYGDSIITNKQTKNRVNGQDITKLMVVHEKVLNVAKQYFNCNRIEGIELDTKVSTLDFEEYHWEARILLGDYMTMTTEIYYPDQVISQFTLALLDSLDFYEANYYTGGLMNFGKNRGCQFIENDCLTIENSFTIVSNFHNEFCSSYEGRNKFGTCSSGRQSMGYCFSQNTNSNAFKRNSNLDFYFGFGKSYIEYCPLTLDYYNIEEVVKPQYYDGNCKIGNGNFGNELFSINNIYKNIGDSFLQNISDTSFCALSSILKKDERNDTLKNIIRPTCYQMNCSDKSLTIQIKDEYVVCPRQGGFIHINDNDSKYNGYLFCPDYNLICSGTKLCNNMFDCVKNKSEIKTTSYNYSDYSNENIWSEVKTNDATQIEDQVETGFELTEEGICPQNCEQCISNKQCIKCVYTHNNYVGTKENDKEPIYCYENPPGLGYYLNNGYRTGKNYYFTCIENCNVCNQNKEKCDQCAPTHKLNSAKNCVERIPGCKNYNTTYFIEHAVDNGGGKAYIECENCNNSDNYFCINMNKNNCVHINNYNETLYFKMENKNYSCIKKCEDHFANCLTCNKSTCILCNKTHHIPNNKGNCVEIIDHCQIQNMDVNHKECKKCNINENYYCIDNDRTKCIKINDINHYFKIDNTDGTCYSNCNITAHCLECTYRDQCTKCENGYFVQGGICYKNITGCIKNIYISQSNEIECDECDYDNNYICINKNRKVCKDIHSENKQSYYPLPDLNYPCYNSCDSLIENCLLCNQTHCLNCTEYFIVNNNLSHCLVRPFKIPDNDNCTVRFHDYSNSIYNLDIWDFIDYYWANNIPYVRVVDHFIGNNYTATIFINSDCTEDLLNKQYFQIDSKELQETMIKEANVEGMKILFSILINYNHKNHFRFHNLESKFLDPNKKCNSCLNINYTFINYFYNSLTNVLGPVVSNVLVSEKTDIVNKDSEIFKDFCHNITFIGIDLPLRKRLKYIYLHQYTEPIFCNAENCTIENFDYEKIATTCKCKYGNTFDDILKGEKFKFTHYEGEDIEASDFADSFGIIKCSISGFKGNNIKVNGGFFLTLICIVAQGGLFVYYSLKSKAIVNITNNMHNPPKRAFLIMNTDWDKELRNVRTNNENEIYVQPRDDADDQLLEEEKSYNNDDIFNTSSLSIDTNVGGINIKNINTADKLTLKEKVDTKKVIILLSKNKNKNKDKNQLITDDAKSDNDITPLSDEYRKDSNINFGKIYWSVVSLKQHIINYFSTINSCRITESYIPLSIRLIRSLFMLVLSFLLNILWLNHTYYENKFEYFNEKYTLIHSETDEVIIPSGEKISYAISNTFGKAMITFVIEIVVQFIIGFFFFSLRNGVLRAKRRSNLDGIQQLILKTRRKYLIFFIINMVLMVIFFFSFTGFGGAYGGGLVDYFTAGFISLIFLQIFPFIWSIILALLRYYGFKKNNKLLFRISQIFMF